MCQVSGQSSADRVFKATGTVSELGEVEKLAPGDVTVQNPGPVGHLLFLEAA